MKWPGRHYHRVYGYPPRWAFMAELAWRLEHCGPFWARYDGRPLATFSRKGYQWRKAAERKGSR